MNRNEIEEKEPSDIGILWKQALDKYYSDTKDVLKDFYGKNGKVLPEMDWDTDTLFKLQEEEAEKFSKFRHKGDTLDKIRSAIGKNSEIIQAVAQNVTDAASASFPPAAAIMTAFTYIMKASKKVSEAYDLIATFFDLLRSFLERISLLGERLPTAKAYKTILMRVFSAIMVLCGLATKDMAKGRFRQWGKALLTGSDDELRNSYDNLEKNIQRLESATMYATLKTTMEIKSDAKEATVISKQTLKLTTENLMINTENSIGIKEIIMVQNKVLRLVQDGQKEVANPDKLNDSGAKKGAALNLIKNFFGGPIDPVVPFLAIQKSFVKDTFTWLDAEEGYQSLIAGTAPLIWVCGERGLGKSYLTYSIIERLEKVVHNEPRTSIAYFFYNGLYEDFHRPKLMLGSTIAMISEFDIKYREEAAAEVVQCKDDLLKEEDDGSKAWKKFFAEKYPRGSDARLILVLNGLDKVQPDHRATLLGYFQQIRQAGLKIQVVFTGRSDLEPSIKSLDPVKIEVTKEKVSQKSGDLWRFAMARFKSLPKLRRVPLRLRKKIAAKLRQEADSFLYVEHMLRRLNGFGRESVIMKELKAPPPDLEALYALMVSDCEENHSGEELAILKRLLVWLAYSNCVLTLGSAKQLISIMAPNTPFSLEEELASRCANILRLATEDVRDEDLASDDGGSEFDEKEEDEESVRSFGESSDSPLKFQERSLRQYFRETSIETGLRSSPSSAHLVLFEMAIRILNIPAYKSIESGDNEGVIFDRRLHGYAARTWMQHFMDIEPSATSDHDTKLVIETLKMALDPTGEALISISISGNDTGLFGDVKNLPERFMGSLKLWSHRTISLPPGFLSTEVSNWIRESSLSLKAIMMPLARGFISNWFKKNHVQKAEASFRFAQKALLLADSSPSVLSLEPGSIEAVGNRSGDIPEITNVNMMNSTPQEVDNMSLKAEDILAVANRFGDMAKSANAYTMISCLMSHFGFYDAAVAQTREGLEKCTSDLERYDMLCTEASIELVFAGTDNIHTDNAHTENAYKATKRALACRPALSDDRNDSKDKALRYRIQQALVFQARCEVMLGRLDEALASMKEARNVYKQQPLGVEILEIIFAALEKQKNYEMIMSTAEQSHRLDLMDFIYKGKGEDHFTLQRAAKCCGKETFMIRLYEKVIADMDQDDEGAYMRHLLARFYRFALNKNDAAKYLFKQLIDGRKGANPYVNAEGVILQARCDLADILMEEFRNALDPKEKVVIYNEMKKLALYDRIAVGTDYSPYESQAAIPLALMSQKLGPAHEFQGTIERAFRDNVNALSDKVAWNDSPAFRMLAKVLACVPGLEKEAQISFSLQFSDVDKALSKSPDASAAEVAIADHSNAENRQEAFKDNAGILPNDVTSASLPKENVIGVGASQQAIETIRGNITTETEIEAPEYKEDLDLEHQIYCSGCLKDWSNWTDGPIYLCVVCTDVDLCEECYQKIVARNRGGKWKEWRTFCGLSHRYIRGPSEGWRGVKDGVMRVGGETIPFKEWLRRLDTRWSEAWKDFWRNDVLVGDIL